jgi:hypothetical protein
MTDDFKYIAEEHSAHWESDRGGWFSFEVRRDYERQLAFDIEEHGRKSSKRVMVSLPDDAARKLYEWLKPIFEARRDDQ